MLLLCPAKITRAEIEWTGNDTSETEVRKKKCVTGSEALNIYFWIPKKFTHVSTREHTFVPLLCRSPEMLTSQIYEILDLSYCNRTDGYVCYSMNILRTLFTPLTVTALHTHVLYICGLLAVHLAAQ